MGMLNIMVLWCWLVNLNVLLANATDQRNLQRPVCQEMSGQVLSGLGLFQVLAMSYLLQ